MPTCRVHMRHHSCPGPQTLPCSGNQHLGLFTCGLPLKKGEPLSSASFLKPLQAGIENKKDSKRSKRLQTSSHHKHPTHSEKLHTTVSPFISGLCSSSEAEQVQQPEWTWKSTAKPRLSNQLFHQGCCSVCRAGERCC